MRTVKVTLAEKFGDVFDRAIVFETPLEEARLHGAA
jgi:hypothetical protein